MKFQHLEDVDMTYWEHFFFATGIAWDLFRATFALTVHAFFPCFFEHTASDIVADANDMFRRGGFPDRVLVRFNTKWKEDPAGRQWRVLVNGLETLASEVVIRTSVSTIEEAVDGEQKFHFLCFGKVNWDGSKAVVWY